MKIKKFGKLGIAVLLCTCLCFGCKKNTTKTTQSDSNTENSTDTATVTPGTAAENSAAAAQAVTNVKYESNNYTISDTITGTITLNGTSATCSGKGAEYKDGVLSITSAGTYKLSGTLTDGRIEINTDKEALVQLILDGVEVTSKDYAPLVVIQADETVIYLAEGTTNTFIDGTDYYTAKTTESSTEEDSDTPSAAIFSQDDLIIEGDGTLKVQANCQDAIVSKDDLLILDGTYQITAADDGLVGKDCIAIADGTITIDAGGDGMKSTKSEDAEKGFVVVEAGNIQITSQNDAIQAETYVYLNGGEFTVTTAGGSGKVQTGQANGGFQGNQKTAVEDSSSAQGVKAGIDITVNDAVFNVNAFDDALHSSGSITINKGAFAVSTGDDLLHADSELVINDGEIQANTCYEGLEACTIALNGGTVTINSTDDGINGASADSTEGNDNFGAPQDTAATQTTDSDSSTTPIVTITGGYLYMNASGDGLDSNGSINMTGGTIIIDGPTNDGNGSLDYNNDFTISGGILIAAGSSGMLQAPSTTSSQNSIAAVFDAAQSADSLVNIQDSNGNTIVTYAPAKSYSAIVVSTPDLKTGSSYTVYTGGSAAGDEKNGYYTSAQYQTGNQFTQFTLTAVSMKVTSSGASEMTQQEMMGGGPRGMGGPGGRKN